MDVVVVVVAVVVVVVLDFVSNNFITKYFSKSYSPEP